MRKDLKYPRVPQTVFKMAANFGVWIVGGAVFEAEPKDVDVMVPWGKWREASLLIPRDAKPNAFGGWKWTEGGVSVDCWPDTLDRLASKAAFQAALHMETGTLLTISAGDAGLKGVTASDVVDGPGQDVCFECGEDISQGTSYGAGDGSRTGRNGFFYCTRCYDIRRFPHVGWCGVEGCGHKQRRTASGPVCRNGHGGAPTLPADPKLTEA